MNNISSKLAKIIQKKIQETGPISFKDFMEICLYHKDFGYYCQKNLPIGKDGDFVTAPHSSKLFGCLLAVQVRECIQICNESCDGKGIIYEFGAGSGLLARDVLGFYEKFHKDFFEEIRYVIVEPLQRRIAVLKEVLADYSSKVDFVSDINNLKDISGVIIGNELFDAFPVHVIEKRDGQFYEVYVDVDEKGNFIECYFDIRDEELDEYIKLLPKELPNDYRTEVNLNLKHWISRLSEVFCAGYGIFIDYGFSFSEYFMPERNRGTLLGYSGQKTTEDFLRYPGLIDITAHVNFSDAKRWFEASGFSVEGYTPQWAFLGGLDFQETLEKVYGRIDPFSPILAGIKAMIFPQGMGESHKVFIVSKGLDRRPPLKGFNIKNYLERLN